ncbi:MAG: peptide deformylase [Actinomycetia bacterium]|nr:peptide deformylase [Actinomycetes bacterium]MCP4083900.1 peptide deformylase [Actinomycetes bacterium]
MTSGPPARGRVRPILVAGTPSLEEACAAVGADDRELAADITDLAATLADFRARSGFGRAISAPQIGIPKRLIVMDLGPGPTALVNPEIIWRSAATHEVWDDCLSVPDVLVRVERHVSVSVRHLTDRFAPTDLVELPPDTSELLQHEIDHLDGVLMTSRATGPDPVVPLARRSELITDP